MLDQRRSWALFIFIVVDCLQMITQINGIYSSCPRNWFIHGSGCFKLVHTLVTGLEAANKSCSTISSSLATVNSLETAEFLSKVLKQEDNGRKCWATSGLYLNNAWTWTADDSMLSFNFWHAPPNDPLLNNIIVFEYINGTYKWSAKPSTTRLSVICETKTSDRRRDVSGFGVPPDMSVPRGPRITLQPEDIIYFSEAGKSWIQFHCEADGYPEPQYSWMKDGSMIDVTTSKRHSFVDGSLLIRNIASSDYGAYYCVASNEVGSVRSRTAFVNSAFMKRFPSSRMDVFAVERRGKSIPCDEPAHFPPSLGYAWLYDTPQHFMQETDRIFTSKGGALYFSHIVAQDQMKYACSIVSSELKTGRYGPFFSLRIDANSAAANQSSKPLIPDEFPKIYPKTPFQSGDVTLECFAYGMPAPSYTWQRVGGQMPLNAELRSFDRRLRIRNLEQKDFGTYRCIARNELGSMFRDITIPFSVKPELDTELEDQFVYVGERVEFTCDVHAVPAPEFEWFKNGSPLTPLLLQPGDVDRIEVLENQLVIKYAVLSDAGMYQCLVTNDLGSVSSTAHLVLRKFAPTFSTHARNKHVYGFLGTNLTLPCKVEASPKPLISWSFNGHSLRNDGKRINVGQNGELRIFNVDQLDAGQYVCRAINELGTAAHTTVVTVSKPVKAAVEPSSIVLESGSNTTLRCEITPSVDCYFETPVSWKFSDVDIHDQLSFKHATIDDNKLTLKNVSQTETGVYMCQIGSDESDHNSIPAVASSVVTVSGIPPQPVRCRVIDVGQNSVSLSWTLPATSFAFSVQKYQIWSRFKLNDFGDDNDWSNWNSLHATILVSLKDDFHFNNYTLTGLKPHRIYSFLVAAGNHLGWSEPCLVTDPIRTLAGPPSAPVKSLRQGLMKAHELTVEWDALLTSDYGDKTVWYRMSWRSLVDNSSSASFGSIDFKDPSASSFVLRNLRNSDKICQAYEISVTPFNEHGIGPTASATMYPYINATLPVPNAVIAQAVNSSTIKVMWQYAQLNLSDNSCPVYFGVGFRIKYVAISNNAQQYPEYINFKEEPASTVIITNLQSQSSYLVSVAAYSSVLSTIGAFSEAVVVATRKSEPKSVPVNLVTTPTGRDGKAVVVSWTSVSTSFDEEHLDGYKLRIVAGNRKNDVDFQELPISKELAGEPPAVEIAGLMRNTRYAVQLLAFSSGGDGQSSKPVEFILGDAASSCSRLVPKLLLLITVLLSRILCLVSL